MNKIKNPKEKLLFIFGVILYALVLRAFNATCIIRSLLHIPCPACGMTRAIWCALRLDFSQAFAYHPLFPFAPQILLYFVFDGRVLKKEIDTIIIITMVAAFLLVWVLRLVGVLQTL